MSALAAATVIDKVGGGILSGLDSLLDNLFTSDEERDVAKLRLRELDLQPLMAQIGVNLKEAAHESIFVSGWRPFIGWVCGFAFAYTYVIQPFMSFIAWAVAALFSVELPFDLLPQLDMTELSGVLIGMLGLGWMRTIEKEKGVNTNR